MPTHMALKNVQAGYYHNSLNITFYTARALDRHAQCENIVLETFQITEEC